MYVVHLPPSNNLFITRQMNTVNIRIVPINRIHRGGLVIMSKKKTHDAGKKKKTKRETVRIGQRQRDISYGRQRETLHRSKKKESQGGKKIG